MKFQSWWLVLTLLCDGTAVFTHFTSGFVLTFTYLLSFLEHLATFCIFLSRLWAFFSLLCHFSDFVHLESESLNFLFSSCLFRLSSSYHTHQFQSFLSLNILFFHCTVVLCFISCLVISCFFIFVRLFIHLPYFCLSFLQFPVGCFNFSALILKHAAVYYCVFYECEAACCWIRWFISDSC